MATVEFRDIHKSYGTVEIVKGVDITVDDGEFVVLVGPSGCGKSTLLRLIAGLEEVSSGQLLVGDKVVNNVSPRDRDIAMVFQSYALYPHMTVRRNLAFALEVRKTKKPEIDARVKEAASMLGLEEFLDRYPKQLSGGQRQRVAMGRAIVRRPKVFLFDEPLSNLDASLRAQMRVELARLHRKLGTTMIYVTHDQVEAMTLADRIAVLNEGILQQVGKPDDLYNKPKNTFVASFIGSPSMNFLDATLLEQDDCFYACGPEETFKLRTSPDKIGVEAKTEQKIRIGIRPHDLKIQDDGGIEGTIDVIEPMGYEALLYITFGGQTLTVHTRNELISGLSTGTSIRLAVDPENIHVFDKKTQKSLAYSS